MLKKILMSSTLLAFAPVMALAASITNVEFDNGDVTTPCKAGSTVNATFRVVVGPSEVVEYVQTDVLSDNLGPKDHEVGGELGLQEGTHDDIILPVKCPPNTGTRTLTARPAGIFGAIRSVDGNDGVNGSTASFSGAIRTVAGGTPVGSGSSIQNQIDSLMALIAALTQKVADVITKPTPPSLCSQIPLGNTYSLQAFLMSHGQAAPFHAIGVYHPTGFYGPVTMQALANFKLANNCQ